MGCMRLSTDPQRDEARAIAVLHAALDAGATWLDTADAYCWNDQEVGHNERLIARALATWSGDRSTVRVATKGGLIRPEGRWIPDGRARHLTAACAASRAALGVDRIDLYQLHAPDPRVPFSTSVRALASLQQHGLIERIGLCNVTLGQIEEARRIVDIDAVQVELSLWHDDNTLSGVVGYCVGEGIRLIAYRPLGGAQRARRLAAHPALEAIAQRHGVTAADVAIAWLLELRGLVPVPGPTRVETAAALAQPYRIQLTDDDRGILEAHFTAAQTRRHHTASTPAPIAPSGRGEIVLIMGLPAAGKSTAARALTADGYARVNRDDEGGSLRGLTASIDRLAEEGRRQIVLDNTYVSRKSRAPVIQAAARHGYSVRCLWLSTGVEDAQVNAVTRMLGRYGRLLGPDEMRRAVKDDVGAFGPGVQFRYQRELEPPRADEGFSRVDVVPFERRRDESRANRAIVVWCDGVIAASRMTSAADRIEPIAGRAGTLRRYADEGWRVLGIDWQPGIADGTVTAEQIEAGYGCLRAATGVEEIVYCPHGAGPPVCWCRKPLPGLGVLLIHKYGLDPSQCVYVGGGAQDPGFARRLGMAYRDASSFFAAAPQP
jgi:aryl-alcohol dehydrogenase-like predicted oxidoreductase/histidinol phosphatase-like enzyme